MIDLYPELSTSINPVQVPPDWIPEEVWVRYSLNLPASITGGTDRLKIIARQSPDRKQCTVFLKNETDQPIKVRLHAPGAGWMFTGSGDESGEQTESGTRWRQYPSMPLPLPKSMDLEPLRVVMLQISDLTPAAVQPRMPVAGEKN